MKKEMDSSKFKRIINQVNILFFILITGLACEDTSEEKEINIVLTCGPGEDDDTLGDDDDDTTGDGDDDDDTSGDDDDDDDSTATLPQISNFQVYSVITNSLAAEVEYEIDRNAIVYVEYGENDYEFKTPEYAAAANESGKINVLGLRPNSSYKLRLVVTSPEAVNAVHSEELEFLSGTVPDISSWWNNPTISSNLIWDEQEVICFTEYDTNSYQCVDRMGFPVFYYNNSDSPITTEVRSTLEGHFLYNSNFSYVIFNSLGQVVDEVLLSEIRQKTENYHISLHHEILELIEGPWKGSIVLLTKVADTVEFRSPPCSAAEIDTFRCYNYHLVDQAGAPEKYKSFGIIIYNPVTGKIDWEYSFHGALGDNLSATDKLPYTRLGLAGVKYERGGDLDWTHANALYHEIGENGKQYMWVSLRSQDWIIKIDLETKEVVWRLGFRGDFTLVDDINSAAPVALDEIEANEKWFYHQHAPEVIELGNGKYEVLLFDNGNIRPRPENDPYLKNEYARVVIYEIDENSNLKRASIKYDYGTRDKNSPDWFYSYAVGDADRMPGGENLLFLAGANDIHPNFISEVSSLTNEVLWKLPLNITSYRVDYFPSIYNRTWQYK